MRSIVLCVLVMPAFCASAGNNYVLPFDEGLSVYECPSEVVTDTGVEYPSPGKRVLQEHRKESLTRPCSMMVDDCRRLRSYLPYPLRPAFYWDDQDPTLNDYSFGDDQSDDEVSQTSIDELKVIAAVYDAVIASTLRKEAGVKSPAPKSATVLHKVLARKESPDTHKRAGWMRRFSEAIGLKIMTRGK